MDFAQRLQSVSAVVAIATSGVALFYRFPDRRHERLKEQDQALADLLSHDGESQHDLIVESKFLTAFGAPVPAEIVRFLLDHSFPRTAIIEYCAVREYLVWDPRASTLELRGRRHRNVWARGAIVLAWVASYLILAGLAAGGLVLGGGAVTGRVAVAGMLIVPAVFCLRQGSILFRAGRFIGRRRDYARPRRPRIAAERGVEAVGVRRDARVRPRAAS